MALTLAQVHKKAKAEFGPRIWCKIIKHLEYNVNSKKDEAYTTYTLIVWDHNMNIIASSHYAKSWDLTFAKVASKLGEYYAKNPNYEDSTQENHTS